MRKYYMILDCLNATERAENQLYVSLHTRETIGISKQV